MGDSEKRRGPMVNLGDLELAERPAAFEARGEAGERFGARMARFSEGLGAVQLGYNVTAVPPGKRAFPFHSHRVNEEMFLILEGEGELRLGDSRYPVRAMDVIACPAGGPETAHQLINTGSGELRYLAVSTTRGPELCEYPDSGKFGVIDYAAGNPSRFFRYVGRAGEGLDYWEGE